MFLLVKRTLAGRSVNPIGLGCMTLSWAYGTPPSDEDGAALLRKALELGYDHLDTARVYGAGHNETLIGKTLAANRDQFFLASKCGIVVEGEKRFINCHPDTVRAACEESLRLLQTDHIDLYYLHRPDPKVPIEDSVGALVDLKNQGKIGAIGLSEMSAETLRRAASVHPIAAMQSEYSPWTRNPEIAVSAACKELGTTLVAFSPVGRGALANGIPDTFSKGDLRATYPRFTGENWQKNKALIAQFTQLAESHGMTAAQLSLSWVLAQGDHIVAIPGTTQQTHLAENIACWDQPLNPAIVQQVDALVNRHTVSGPRYPEVAQVTVTTEEFA
jgi:aryl-alcohol dehydrogenase-like predicted oxidoreductase